METVTQRNSMGKTKIYQQNKQVKSVKLHWTPKAQETGELRDLVKGTDSKKVTRDSFQANPKETRQNLIHLCKNRNLSEVAKKERNSNNTSSTRESETKTESSSTYLNNSAKNSPVMQSLFLDEEAISEKPSQAECANETKSTFTLNRVGKKRSFFCSASYKVGPSKGQMPSLRF